MAAEPANTRPWRGSDVRPPERLKNDWDLRTAFLSSVRRVKDFTDGRLGAAPQGQDDDGRHERQRQQDRTRADVHVQPIATMDPAMPATAATEQATIGCV